MRSIQLSKDIFRELEEFDTDIRAALGDKYFGASSEEDTITLHFADNLTKEEESQARAIFQQNKAAIKPLDPTPSERRALRVNSGIEQIKGMDFKDIQTRIDGISNLSEAKAFLTLLARAVYFLASAQGIVEQDIDS